MRGKVVVPFDLTSMRRFRDVAGSASKIPLILGVGVVFVVVVVDMPRVEFWSRRDGF